MSLFSVAIGADDISFPCFIEQKKQQKADSCQLLLTDCFISTGGQGIIMADIPHLP
ncbi:hypothetical protein yfred0001_6710 [Yersinia frederiksenii ATCC 33641]|nr:hypothetical protein yfred0001_6710 [Yersinia frederiksenii ATCC 33641]